MQGAKDVKGGDRLPRQLRRDIVGDAGETENLDVQYFASRLHGLEVLAAVVAQAQVELVSFHRFPDGIVVPIKLVSDGRPDEVGPVGVEALLDEEIDMAEVDIAEVDRDLLAVRALGRSSCTLFAIFAILSPSVWMVYGWWRWRVQAPALIIHSTRHAVSRLCHGPASGLTVFAPHKFVAAAVSRKRHHLR